MAGIQIKDYLRETRIFNARISVIAAIIGLLVLLLFLRLAYLQLINYRYYATLSQANRINPVPIPPVRGLIYDRNGVLLAQNYPVMTLEIIPDQVDNMDALLAELGKLVALNDKDIKNFRKLLRERPRFESLALRTHLTDEEAARFAVNRYRLNGAELRARLQRHYPLGGLGVHAIGYVGRINEDEADAIDKNAYRGTQHIGKLGVEANYEDRLLGQVGFEKIETDAHGRALRTLERIAPVAGLNLRLSLDARMQALAEQALGSYKGAVIAMDPKTGAILTFASTPTYDPNPFVNGIDSDSYQALRENPDKPLINRALNGKYSPGSTIKAFFGLAALEYNQTAPITCPGWYTLPGDTHHFRCWKKAGHGFVNLHDAVVQSCDVYFYRLAVALGPDRLSQFLGKFGFGAVTGVDLKGESDGLLPSPAWKQARGQPWYPGETVVMGIGQGQLLVTPLQLAEGISMIANAGIGIQPHLVASIENPKSKALTPFSPIVHHTLDLLDRRHLETTVHNLTDVVNAEGGTARGIGWNAPYKIAGKTGTAQVKGIAQGESYRESQVAEHLRDHALFIAFAPVEDPRIAVAVIVENGGHGGSTAAPIARKLMDLYLLGEQPAAEKPKAAARPAKPMVTPAVAPAGGTTEEESD
jgi:penicillin-binding protein 2